MSWHPIVYPLRHPVLGVKRLTRMIFRRNPLRIFIQPRSSFDYAGEVGDGTGSSAVMAPLLWIARTFPEAPPALFVRGEDGQEEMRRDHDVLRLLQRPNRFYTGHMLWMATLADWNVDGNAYWLKLRRGTGAVAELWWAPQWMMEPRGDEGTLITHYEYRTGYGDALEIAPEDVVHFRFGLDPDDTRKGYSPLKSVLREVFTDDEAANFTASLLRNMGVPGLVVSPEGERRPTEEDVAATKAYIADVIGGDRRGSPLVMSGPTKVAQFGFSPEQLLLRELRRIPEERVSAVLGVPAIVAGLGAGLERSTFTNMSEAREMAYESNIIPSQRMLGEDVRFQLLADFLSDEELWATRFGFDLSQVRVLQEDEDKRLRRFDVGYRGGWVKRSEARRAIGLPVSEERDDVYLVPLNVAEVPADGSAQAAPAANGNAAALVAAREIAAEVIRELERTRALPT